MQDKSKTRAVSITLPEDLIEQAQAAVAAREARSVSAWITERLRAANERDPYDEFIAAVVTANPDLTASDWRQVGNDIRMELDAAYGHADQRRAEAVEPAVLGAA